MKTVIFNTVQDLVIPMDEKDALSFKILEENILKYGLEGFIDHNSELYLEHYKVLRDRLIYDERNIKQYLHSLDLAYQIRIQFLSHMHNQNVIEVCHKDSAEKDFEILRLKELLDALQNKG